MTVLCPILCKLSNRRQSFFSTHSTGAPRGYGIFVYTCTVRTVTVSAMALTSLYRQYRGRQNHCQRPASEPIRSPEKFTHGRTSRKVTYRARLPSLKSMAGKYPTYLWFRHMSKLLFRKKVWLGNSLPTYGLDICPHFCIIFFLRLSFSRR